MSFAGVPSARATRSQHLLVGGVLFVAASVSWLQLVSAAEIDAGVDAALFGGMWLAMVGAMMLPTIEPMVVAYVTLTRELPLMTRAARTATFVAPYLMIWAVAGLLALALRNVALDRPIVAVGLIAAVGLYQLGALMKACLRSCRSPLSFFLRQGGDPSTAAGALRSGIRHAALCFGCCVGLMVALAGAGATELTWMAALGLLMLVEKVHRHGRQISRASGVLLIALAPVTLVVSSMGDSARIGGLIALGILSMVALATLNPRRASAVLPHPH